MLADKNSVIHYYILLGNEKGYFYIDKTSGDIYTNASLDRFVLKIYFLDFFLI